MKKIYLLTIILTSIFLISCNDLTSSGPAGTEGGWLIPEDKVFDGGPGKDGIPALTNPDLTSASSISFMKSNDLVLGIKIDGEVRGYPHPILDWHEIINDNINDKYYTVTYCPLTGSGIGWNRELNGSVTTFGVSGLLYNTNLIPYDRATNSNWSQMKLQCVNGQLEGSSPDIYQVVETSWETWLKIYPDAQTVSDRTGHSRQYGNYPYGSYRTNNNLIFPVGNNDSRLPMKERVHGIIEGATARAYRFDSFESGIVTINGMIRTNEIVVVGSKESNFIVSYYTKLDDGTTLEFQAVQNQLPVILKDNEGNSWDIFGQAVEGIRLGQNLKPTKSFIAYWFAWAAFYPNTDIHEL